MSNCLEPRESNKLSMFRTLQAKTRVLLIEYFLVKDLKKKNRLEDKSNIDSFWGTLVCFNIFNKKVYFCLKGLVIRRYPLDDRSKNEEMHKR